MRKFFFVLTLLLPKFAVAGIDVSNCEVVGYMNTNLTEKSCVTMEKCQQSFEQNKDQQAFDICVKSIKTPEECVQYLTKQQDLSRRERLIYKCPMTQELLKFKTQEWRDMGGLQKYANYNDGTPIDADVMISDNEYAYLFRMELGLSPSLTEQTKYGYDIIGPADKDGMMFSFIGEE